MTIHQIFSRLLEHLVTNQLYICIVAQCTSVLRLLYINTGIATVAPLKTISVSFNFHLHRPTSVYLTVCSAKFERTQTVTFNRQLALYERNLTLQKLKCPQNGEGKERCTMARKGASNHLSHYSLSLLLSEYIYVYIYSMTVVQFVILVVEHKNNSYWEIPPQTLPQGH